MRIALKVVWLGLLLASAMAFLVGGVMTLFALSPGTDMGDAYVFSRFGPGLALGGLVGGFLARRVWHVVQPHHHKPSPPQQ
ncbi:MAG TPA: hypothetical protein VNW92_21685 [Polyangiaceae bacterium]|nr:hypothetical protein [Polyangiaceae bacterium]